MNSKYQDTETFCLHCGTSFGFGYLAHNKKYCDNKCQQAAQVEKARKEWLETGMIPLKKGSAFRTDSEGNILRQADLWTAPQESYVREYLLERQHNFCAICKNEFVWQGKPLIAILDHIDGNGFNNTPENLQLLCPNCSYQLPTSKGANRGRGRKARWDQAI